MEVQEKNSRQSINNIIIALIFIAAGFVLVGRNIGIISFELSRILISWQMLLVVIGAVSLLRNHQIGGAIMITIGLFFMLHLIPGMGYWGFSRFWPLIFVAIGLIIIFGKKEKHTHWNKRWVENHESISYESVDGYVTTECSFGSVIRVVTDPVFKGAKISNSFASTVLDLRRTTIQDGETYIDIDSSFGGVEIYIPENWTVKNFVKNSFSGTTDKRYHSMNPDTSKVLVIRGSISFSGLEIKG